MWREGPSSEIETYQYTRHVFGARSSPTCANFVVQQTARDNETEFPLASQAVFSSFYVHDFLRSNPSPSEVVKLAVEPGATFNANCSMKGGVKELNKSEQQKTITKSEKTA